MYPAHLGSGHRGRTRGTLQTSRSPLRRHRPRPVPLLGASLLVGCASGEPTIVAEKAGWARFPANSEAAVAASLHLDEAAIEVDVFLTNDRVPVLIDGPRLDPLTCRTVDGAELEDDVWLLQNDLVDLDDGYRCGVEADPAWPDARVGAAPVHTLDGLVEQLLADPPAAVLLDVRWTPNVSHAPEVFAAEVLERWWRDDPPTTLRVVADRPQMVQAIEDRAAAAGRDVVTLLRWPTEPPLGSAAGARLATMLAADAGAADPWNDVSIARADGLLADARVLRRSDVARRPAAAELGLQGGSSGHPAAAWLDATDWVLDATGGVQ